MIRWTRLSRYMYPVAEFKFIYPAENDIHLELSEIVSLLRNINTHTQKKVIYF